MPKKKPSKNNSRRPSAGLAGLPERLIRSKSKSGDVQLDQNVSGQANALGDGFFSMPNEIQVEILGHLQASDILSLRLTSKSMSRLLSMNASVVTRSILRKTALGEDPFYLQELYRPEQKIEDLTYLLHMMHRERIVAKMIWVMAEYAERKIYLIKTDEAHEEFAPSREMLHQKFQKPTAIIYHYLELYKRRLAERMEAIKTDKKLELDAKKNGLEVFIRETIIGAIPRDSLVHAFSYFQLLAYAFRQKLRPPTYAGSIERRARGWDGVAASNTDVAIVLMCGGMEEVQNIMRLKKYSDRTKALDMALIGLTSGFEPEEPAIIKQFYTPLPPVAVHILKMQMKDIDMAGLDMPWFRVIMRRQNARTGEECKELAESMPNPFDYLDVLIGRAEPSDWPGKPSCAPRLPTDPIVY